MIRSIARPLVLAIVLFAAGVVMYRASFRLDEGATTGLAWVADAHQFGPVGYRDPAGALSPDGRWIAYSEGRFLRVRAVEGGPLVEFPAGDAQIRNIVWSPDNRTILADGAGHDRSHTQDAAGLVAGRPADRLHGVELRAQFWRTR